MFVVLLVILTQRDASMLPHESSPRPAHFKAPRITGSTAPPGPGHHGSRPSIHPGLIYLQNAMQFF
jgi:hypothetical protein